MMVISKWAAIGNDVIMKLSKQKLTAIEAIPGPHLKMSQTENTVPEGCFACSSTYTGGCPTCAGTCAGLCEGVCESTCAGCCHNGCEGQNN